MSPDEQWELKEWLLRLMDERHSFNLRVMDEREKRWLATFVAQEKAVLTALTAAERAVSKAETGAEKRFDSVNEFRAQLADQAGTFMPRSEAEIRFSRMDADVSELRTFRDSSAGRGLGINAAWGFLIGAIGLAATVVAIVMAVAR